jgi:histidyl-tRNA synthetase
MALSVKPPSGMRDFLPLDVARRNHVVDVIRRVYRRHGFQPLETPALERLEVLTGKYGEEGDQLMFRVLKRGEALPPLHADLPPAQLADLALRYDLTVPLARVMAACGGRLPRFFKRFQIQPVWRADRPQRGRFREFYQCDVDCLGTTSWLADVSVVAAAVDALLALGFDRFTVRLNDRRVLTGLLDTAGVPPALQQGALVALDKLDKIGADGVTAELSARGLDAAMAADLLAVTNPPASLDDAGRLDALLQRFEGRSPGGLEGVTALRRLIAGLRSATGLEAGPWRVDPSLARGLSYYTGPIFEVEVEGLSGSMGGGGRYDGLIGMFQSQPVPAVGFSLGLERILVVMEERGMFPASLGAPVDLLLLPMDADGQGFALQAAQAVRAAGGSADVYPEPVKLAKQLAYAESLGVTRVGIIGSREREAGEVLLRDMRDGSQRAVPLADLPTALEPLDTA